MHCYRHYHLRHPIHPPVVLPSVCLIRTFLPYLIVHIYLLSCPQPTRPLVLLHICYLMRSPVVHAPPPSPVLLPRALFIRIPCCLLLYLSVLLYLLFVLVHSCCVYNSRCSIGGCRGRGQEGPLYLCSHLPILFPPCSLSPPCLLVPSASPYLFTYPLCLTLPRGRPPGLATFGYLARHPCV